MSQNTVHLYVENLDTISTGLCYKKQKGFNSPKKTNFLYEANTKLKALCKRCEINVLQKQ